MKTCSSCKISKDFVEFYKCKSKKDGLGNECKSCDRLRGQIKLKNPAYLAKRKEWALKNKDKMKNYHAEYARTYYLKNKDGYAQRNREWVKKNPERSRELGRINFQKPERKHKHRINQAARRATVRRGTIKGFEDQIREIYDRCPVGFHVDHIIPLRGKGVCGLHVPWNLQYLSAEENRKKNNKVIL